jgi:hypothetical protein
VVSGADPSKTVANVWDGEWILPFGIVPLGTLARQLHMHEARALWPFLRNLSERHTSVATAMNLTGTTTFVPVKIQKEDWFRILDNLAGGVPQPLTQFG